MYCSSRAIAPWIVTAALAALLAPACGGGDSSGGGGAATGGEAGGGAPTSTGAHPATTSSTGSHATATGTSAGGSSGTSAGGGSGTSSGGSSGTSSGAGGSIPAPVVCDVPIMPVDTSAATNVVGDGTAGSCDEGALQAAVAVGGAIVFDCGGPIRIQITHQLDMKLGVDTTIDGGGQVTIDGSGMTRIFNYDSANFRASTNVLSFQHITLANGKSSGTALAPESPPCSQGTDIDGGGAAIWVRDAIVHVVDVTFDSNTGPSVGPDVAGGGLYVLGCLDAVVVGSTFQHNRMANGGAIGSLNSDLTVVNDAFDDNRAQGTDANSIDTTSCHSTSGEVGDGGNGGAISIDGGSDGTVTVCGCSFTNNQGHAFGGAMFRTPDGAMQATNIDQTTFDGNTTDGADQIGGGGALYFHNSALTITRSTLSNNTAPGAGALQADGTNLVLENDTFANNHATKGLGGAISIFSNGGSIDGCTFVGNATDGADGPGFAYFGAAIAGNQTFTVDNSIFANDTTMDCGAPMACQINGSGQGDVQFPATHTVCNGADPPCGGASGTTFADPGLAALANNGGPTKTAAPSATGPAAGAGQNCLPIDQRGNPRAASGCTAGAYELP